MLSLSLLHAHYGVQSLGTSDVNLSAAIMGSQTLSLPKETPPNVVVPGGHRENWGESNMADASPRTDTSTDDTDDKNQRVIVSYLIFSKFCF